MKTRQVKLDCDFGLWLSMGDPEPAPPPKKTSYWLDLLEVEQHHRSYVTVRRVDVNSGEAKRIFASLRGRPPRN